MGERGRNKLNLSLKLVHMGVPKSANFDLITSFGK